jgi:hypothetical protein
MYRFLLKIGIFLQVPLKKGIQLLKSGLEKFVEKKDNVYCAHSDFGKFVRRL